MWHQVSYTRECSYPSSFLISLRMPCGCSLCLWLSASEQPAVKSLLQRCKVSVLHTCTHHPSADKWIFWMRSFFWQMTLNILWRRWKMLTFRKSFIFSHLYFFSVWGSTEILVVWDSWASLKQFPHLKLESLFYLITLLRHRCVDKTPIQVSSGDTEHEHHPVLSSGLHVIQSIYMQHCGQGIVSEIQRICNHRIIEWFGL